MANFDRNVYEPSEEVRLYDSVEEEEDIEGSRLPLLIVLALLVLAMFAGVVWLAYTQGVARGRGETPVLTAANGPERVTPQEPGGTNVPYQGFKIYEQPAPPDDAAEAPPASNAPAAQAPAAEAPKPAPSVAAPPPAAPKPAPATQSAPPKSVASLIQQSQTPPMRPTVPATPTGPATGAPRSIVPAAPAPAAPAPKPAASGGVALQIGAFKTRAEADAAWRAYSGKHAALLKGYGPDIQEADLGDKGTWYRLRIAGFGDREMAMALCDRLKADGGGCFLGR
jgi:cell division protein FtsN